MKTLRLFMILTVLFLNLAGVTQASPAPDASGPHLGSLPRAFKSDVSVGDVQAAAPNSTDNAWDTINLIGAQAKKLSSYYSDARSAVDVAIALGQALGWLEASLDMREELKALHDHLDRIAVAITMQDQWLFQARNLGAVLSAVDAARTARAMNRTLPFDSPANENSRGAVYAAEAPGAFTRAYSERMTGGRWRDIVSARPPVTSGNVYDWRIGVPPLMQLIALRLQIIAAVDPNFRNNNYFDAELLAHRQALLDQYKKMEEGITCGATWPPIGPNPPPVHDLACVDIYTGYAAYRLGFRTIGSDPYKEIEAAQAPLKWEVRRKMPFFEMRSMIDTLYLYASGKPDLTEFKPRIRVDASPNLCLEVFHRGAPVAGSIVQIYTCDGSNEQKWVYDRENDTVRLPVFDKYLDVQNSNPRLGATVQIWHSNGTEAQRWTYDPKEGVLQNALGTVLDIQYNRQQIWTPVWTWSRNEGPAQRWRADVRLGPVPPIPFGEGE